MKNKFSLILVLISILALFSFSARPQDCKLELKVNWDTNVVIAWGGYHNLNGNYNIEGCGMQITTNSGKVISNFELGGICSKEGVCINNKIVNGFYTSDAISLSGETFKIGKMFYRP